MIDFLPWILLLSKLVILVLLLFYLVFSYVVLTKVKLLAEILETEVSPILLAFVALNIVVALGLFLLAIFIL